jgi:putative (di)nucleoside polyphosphate hydrolase
MLPLNARHWGRFQAPLFIASRQKLIWLIDARASADYLMARTPEGDAGQGDGPIRETGNKMASKPENSELSYRPCVGIMLVNMDGKVFVGQRLDNVVEAWQMPQGGIDEGEDARAAALRELGEETGIDRAHVEIIAKARNEHFYDLPPELVGKLGGGRYRGQRQYWYLARFLGQDGDIDIRTPHPEFRDWKWVDPETLPDIIVPFKRKLYRDILHEFRSLI